ncbi:MAG: hypothetical protein AB7F31_04175 [Parachlamydiales bacterium]
MRLALLVALSVTSLAAQQPPKSEKKQECSACKVKKKPAPKKLKKPVQQGEKR